MLAMVADASEDTFAKGEGVFSVFPPPFSLVYFAA